MNPPQVHSIIEGTIETLAFGGEGILRYQGFVIFVPFTAPGDQITCEVTEIRSSYGKGKLVSIVIPSTERIQPFCPYFGRCGGCQLQHLSTSAQDDYKVNAVVDALSRISQIVFPPPHFIPATLKWEYRRHITLHLKASKDGFIAGYIGSDHVSLIVIEACPIFISESESILQEIQSFLSTLTSPEVLEGKLTVLKNNKGKYILLFKFSSHMSFEPFMAFLKRNVSVAGIILQTNRERKVAGHVECEFTFEDLLFHYSPESFVQNHPEQSSKIYRKVCELIGDSNSKTILDLYCGFGVTSLLLANHGHQVIGIESNPHAIHLAKKNASVNQLDKCTFVRGDVEKTLPQQYPSLKPDTIVINPPRVGMAKKAVDQVIRYQARECIYISCMPATLARDLKYFLKAGYQINSVYIYDMFPQTAHVETLVHLSTN